MARRPRPWYWKERQSWMATINGTRHTLARGSGPAAKKQALKHFHVLMAKADEPRPLPSANAPVLGELAVSYQADLEARQARGELSRYAVVDFRRRVAGFVERFGDLPARELRPYHVEEWLAARTTLGPTSRHDAVGAAKAVTRWAARMGLIESDPLSGVRKPPRPQRRVNVMDAREARAVVTGMRPGPFQELLTFLYETGCRPSEAASIEASHVDLIRSIVILPEHKTRHKTGKPRVIPLTPAAAGLVAKLAAKRPRGPIFRNARGNAWTKDAVNCAVRRLRARSGVTNAFVAYALRHGWATDALAAGEPVALVAEMLGHSSPRMLAEVYSHLAERVELLTEAAARVRKSKG